VPLEKWVEKFTNMRFEPAGITDDPDIRMVSSVMDYIFRRLALDHLPYDVRADLGILSVAERSAILDGEDPAAAADEVVDTEELAQSAPREERRSAVAGSDARGGEAEQPAATPAAPTAPAAAGSSTELIESHQGRVADAPLCLTCGTKMRPAGSCYVCEGCGSTSGCSERDHPPRGGRTQRTSGLGRARTSAATIRKATAWCKLRGGFSAQLLRIPHDLARGRLRDQLARAGLGDPEIGLRVVSTLDRQPESGKLSRFVPLGAR
jgi:hypothetical protein